MPGPPHKKCNVVIDEPAAGAWNMAVDEALLDDVAKTGTPTLRFYAWESPTLSLGYFQAYAERKQHPDSFGAEVVRRLSGGGAILHDRELTYSLLLPDSHALAQDTQALYDIVHQTIASELNSLLTECGSYWHAKLCEQPSELRKEEEPFLCFQRRTVGDILLTPRDGSQDSLTHKVVGSAQRRRRGSVLQHGSILLHRSTLAPNLIGVFDEVRPDADVEARLLDSLAREIPDGLGLKPERYHFEEQLLTKSRELNSAKFASDAWTKRR